MAVKVTGDFAKKLTRWAELLETSSVLVKHTSRAQAEVALTLIGEGFDNQQDPYGRRWAPKKKPDGRKVLHGETTRLRNGWHVTKAGMGGWTVDPAVEYAAYHQAPRGGSRPKRMMVPEAGRGLPKEWAEEFEAVAIAEAIEHFAEAASSAKPKVKKRTRSVASSKAPAASKSGSRKTSGRRQLRQIRTLGRR